MKSLVAAFLLLVIASCGNVTTASPPRSSSETSNKGSSGDTSSNSLWNYEKSVDPITKKESSKAYAELPATNTEQPVIADLTWSCPDGTIWSTNIEIDTFLNKVIDGNYVGLPQNPTLKVDYRFDGVPGEVWPSYLSGGIIKRDYNNAIKIQVVPYAGKLREKGHVTFKAAYEIKNFYIVDSDFVARIPTEAGDATFEFSLNDRAIKNLLTDCGFTYGPPPGRADPREKTALSKSAAANEGLGLDFPEGTTVLSVAAGLVTWAGEKAGYGLMVEINHGNDLMTRFNQNSKIMVKKGDMVSKGQPIAIAGPAEHSNGNHPRFEILKDGVEVDPLKFINASD